VTLEAGHKVLVYNEAVRRGQSKKLSPQYIGPYVGKYKNQKKELRLNRCMSTD